MEVNLDKMTPVDIEAGDVTANNPCDRLTVQFGIHHEHCTQAPIAMHSRFSDLLTFVRRPNQERVVVGPEWVSLDLGKIPPEEVGYVVISVPRLPRAMKPTPERKAEDEAKHLVVATDGEKGWRVYPGRFMLGYPEECGSVRLRAPNGPLEVNYMVVSR